MSTLAGWLLQQIDYDEQVARDLQRLSNSSPGTYLAVCVMRAELAMGDCPSEIGEHDPSIVLAHCASLREIVRIHSDYPDDPTDHDWACERVDVPNDCPTLRALSLVYRDRRGWGEWE